MGMKLFHYKGIFMKCTVCGRELREDSRFCDYCSAPVSREEKTESQALSFNYKALIFGILLSIFLTLVITGAARAFGLPILFGGLFLPFFFITKKKKQR